MTAMNEEPFFKGCRSGMLFCIIVWGIICGIIVLLIHLI
jgi:hypothetical protein